MHPWPGNHELAPDLAGVHIWFTSLAVSPETLRTYESVLSDDERKRASAFRFEIHRSRFMAARAILRVLASRYLGMAPRDIEFRYGKNGKPEIVDVPLHFNLSHSGDRGVFAFTPFSPLGIDLEHIRPVPEMLDIARRFFSPREAAAICALPPHEHTKAFYRCWTRKEALIKATGEGLSFALDCFSVSVDEPAALLHFEPKAAELDAWSLFHLAPEQEYVGALAMRKPVSAVALIPFTVPAASSKA